MIRCAVDAREYRHPNHLTGTGRFLTNLLVPLVAQATGEFEFILYTHSPDAVPMRLWELPGITVSLLPRVNGFITTQLLLPRLARAAGADCLFCPTWRAPNFPGLPLLVAVHDIQSLHNSRLAPLTQAFTRLQLRAIVRQAQRVITISRYTERDLMDLAPVEAENVVRIYTDVGIDWHVRLTDHSRAGHHEPTTTPFGRFFLHVGSFRPHKQIDMLIHGFHAAIQDGQLPEHNLVLAGGDPENAQRLCRLIQRLGLDSRVILCRDIEDAELANLYHRADWFVTASRYESFGYPLVEAMTALCPVLCHPVASLIDIVGGAAMPIAALTIREVAASLAAAAQLPPEERLRYVESGLRQCRLFQPGLSATAFGHLLRDHARHSPHLEPTI